MESMQEMIERLKVNPPIRRKSIGQANQTNSNYDEVHCRNNNADIEHLQKYGIYERYINCTFEILNMASSPEQVKKQMRMVNEYADNLKDNILAGRGLILKGPVGTGKTSLAIAVMRRAIELRYSCFFIPMVSLMDNLFTMRDMEEKVRFENRVRNTNLLVLDDLGAEYDQQWILTKVDSIITERYNRLRSTIVTTNLTNDGMLTRYNQRILDRLRSTCKMIKFEGKSLRDEGDANESSVNSY